MTISSSKVITENLFFLGGGGESVINKFMRVIASWVVFSISKTK